jgi:hypothetical protein
MKSELQHVLTPEVLRLLLQKIETMRAFSEDVLIEAREVMGRAYNRQMLLAVGLSAAQAPAVAMMWTNKPFLPKKDQDIGSNNS